jgi:hypothetical protein
MKSRALCCTLIVIGTVWSALESISAHAQCVSNHCTFLSAVSVNPVQATITVTPPPISPTAIFPTITAIASPSWTQTAIPTVKSTSVPVITLTPQFLITPLPSTTPLPTPTSTPTPDPGGIALVSARSFYRSGTLYVVGEARNERTAPVYFVQVSARFYDATGTLVATDYTYTFLQRLSPLQKSPFKLILSNPPDNVAKLSLAISYSNSSIFKRQDVSVLSTNTRNNFGVEVFGEVENSQSYTVSSAEAYVTFYDEAQQVVDAQRAYISPSLLGANSTGVFSVKTFRTDLVYANFTVQAQGGIYE